MMTESPPHEVVEVLAAARSNASSMDLTQSIASQDLENLAEGYNNHNQTLSIDSSVHQEQAYNHLANTSSNVSEILDKAAIAPAAATLNQEALPVPAAALTSFTRRNPPVHLEWKDINYHVNVREKIVRVHKKHILNNVSGSVGPGEILAIMGPSGCGKTTLLDILSGRIINNISGDLLVNGAHQLIGSRDYAWYRSLIGYVYQDDIQHGNLTVYEVILLSAMLRLPSSLSLHEKKARVLQVIHELGLTRCMNTKIGIPGVRKSLSGGERKRVSIAQELITDPSVIFLDEPTTGLDSKTAFNLLKLLRKIATTGRTIILTIHQPRADIFEMFDKLLLLTRGNVAYFGKTSHALPYFKSIGYPCPAQYNPADFCIDLLVQGRHTTAGAEVEDEERINKIINHFKEKNAKEHIQLLTEPVVAIGTGTGQSPQHDRSASSSSATSTSEFQYAPLNTKRSQYSSNWFVQLFTVFIRSFINIMRDRTLTVAKFFQTIGMGLFVGFIFFQLGNDQTSIQSRQGVLFFVMMGGIYSALMIIPKEQEIVRRERLAKSYRVSSYFIAKNLAEVPSLVIFPTISTSLLYWIVGFNPTAERFFTFVLIVIILSFTSQAFGQFIATLIPKPTVSVTLTSTCLTVFMLLGGFYLNRNSIPNYLEWVYWLSFFHYGYEALIINEFKDQAFVCTDSELVGPRKVCPITNGNTVIDNLGMNSSMSNIWIDIALLLALAFGYLILTYLVLRFVRKPLWYRFRLPSFARSK